MAAGAGLTKTGNTLDVGQGNGLQVQADTVGIATGGVIDGMIASGNLDPNKLMSAVPITKGGTGAASAAAARTGSRRLGSTTAPLAPTREDDLGYRDGDARAWLGAGRAVLDDCLGSGQIEFPDVVIQGNGTRHDYVGRRHPPQTAKP